jgi:hypothetical protein
MRTTPMPNAAQPGGKNRLENPDATVGRVEKTDTAVRGQAINPRTPGTRIEDPVPLRTACR